MLTQQQWIHIDLALLSDHIHAVDDSATTHPFHQRRLIYSDYTNWVASANLKINHLFHDALSEY